MVNYSIEEDDCEKPNNGAIIRQRKRTARAEGKKLENFL
jgi:hypothetical protein